MNVKSVVQLQFCTEPGDEEQAFQKDKHRQTDNICCQIYRVYRKEKSKDAKGRQSNPKNRAD